MIEKVFCSNMTPSFHILIALSRDTPLAHLSCHLELANSGARCQVPSLNPGKTGIPEKSLQNAIQGCLNQVVTCYCTPVESYGPNLSQATFCHVSALENRWFPEGTTFEQNTLSKICLSIKILHKTAWHFVNSKKKFLWTGLISYLDESCSLINMRKC